MSVLAKGMEIPKCCRECRIIRVDLKCYCGKTVRQKEWKSETRPDWCPLVALPDHHGRLVDADAFKADYGMKDDCADCEKEMQGKVRACEYDRIYSKMDFCSWLDDAYTIVEAEDGT